MAPSNSGTRVGETVDVNPGNLGSVDDSDTVEQYAAEAQQMEEQHDPDDII